MQKLLENVSHTTKSRPYSFHTTVQTEAMEQLLYVHWHPEIEFIYVESGAMELHIENNSYPLRQGEFVIIPAARIHYGKSLGGSACTFRAFLFSPNYLLNVQSFPYLKKYISPFLSSGKGTTIHVSRGCEDYFGFEGLVTELFSLETLPPESCELKLHGVLLLLWQKLYNTFLVKEEETYDKKALKSQLSGALDYIHSHYEEALTLEHLAGFCNVSREHFCRSFKSYTGLSPIKYINRYRIMQSCLLLKDSDEKIANIAMASGFNNISYYNREFVAWMGISPAKYRRESLSAEV